MKKIVIVAGGTAGHINAALAIGEFFKNQDWEIEYISGQRYLDKKLFPHNSTLFLSSSPLRNGNIIQKIINLFKNLFAFIFVFNKFILQRPTSVMGAGGYVCGPTLMAAYVLGIPVFIIEQNAIAGVTNKILARFAKKIFTHFKNTQGVNQFQEKIICSGNPTRSAIHYVAQDKTDHNLSILVFGGSLGAEQINLAIFKVLEEKLILNCNILHQVGKGGLNSKINVNPSVNYHQVEYIENMQKAYQEADIIIARAGASTISELRIVQKPAILIPYPQASDNHQFHNATEYDKENIAPTIICNPLADSAELAKLIVDKTKEITTKERIGLIENKIEISAVEIIFKEINKYDRN